MTLIDATSTDPAMVFAAEPSVKLMSLVYTLAMTKEHSAMPDRSLLGTVCPISISHGTVDIVFVLSMRDTYSYCFLMHQTSFELCSLCLVSLRKSKDHGEPNAKAISHIKQHLILSTAKSQTLLCLLLCES